MPGMTYAEVLATFKTQAAIARALGIQGPSVAEWAANDRIPLLRQHQIERLTGGALKADDPVTEATRRRGRRHRVTAVAAEATARAEGGALMLPGEG